MKKNYKVLLFLIVITAFVNLILFVLIFKKDKNNKKLPLLYTEGKNIKRSDNNKIIRLKGVSSMAFARYNYDINEFISILNTFKTWKINILGLYISQKKIIGQEEKLDMVINWAEQNKIYIYLMPTLDSDNEKWIRTTVNTFPAMMSKLALKYKNKTHILYGLWAEPRYFSSAEWDEYFGNGIRLIREVNSKVIILISGLQHARLIPTDSIILNYKNVILDFHDYPAANIKELLLIKKQKYPWEDYFKNKPILIGEFGGVYSEGFSSKEDLEYINKVLVEANKNSLSYTAYSIDKEESLSLLDWKTRLPTEKGKIIMNDLIKPY